MGAQHPEIRCGTTSDRDAVMALERAANAEPWAGAFFSGDLTKDRSQILLISPAPGCRPVSCLCYWMHHDEIHIVNLATHPDHRRQGFAARLLRYLVMTAMAEEIRYVVLEVRRSNEAAIALYRNAGFRKIGVRPLYYSDREDALLMIMSLDVRRDASGVGES